MSSGIASVFQNSLAMSSVLLWFLEVSRVSMSSVGNIIPRPSFLYFFLVDYDVY